MATVYLSPGPFGAGGQFFTLGGLPLNKGRLYTYAAGGTTPQATYTTSAGTVQNSNYIELSADGRPPNEIWLLPLAYRFDLKDSLDNLIKTYDDIPGGFINSTEIAPFIDSTALIRGSSDSTKLLRVEVDGFTTATTRVLTPPDADLTLPAVTAAGDIPIASASGVLSKIAVGAAGTVPMSRTAATLRMAYVAALSKCVYGWTYANNGNDNLDIAAGGGMDATGAYWITGAALTKNITIAWVVGSAQGGLDTGAVGNNDYYIWAIVRSDTGVVDYLFSLSSTAPTMPANYDFKRLIGWFKRVGAVNVAMTTYETEGGGLELMWSSPTLDVNLANTLTTARRTDAVKVPLNFSVIVHLNIAMFDASAVYTAWVYCPDQADLVPSGTVAPLATIAAQNNAPFTRMSAVLKIRTSAAGLIAARADLATVDLYAVSTMGFTWARRN